MSAAEALLWGETHEAQVCLGEINLRMPFLALVRKFSHSVLIQRI
jgi:hypothetical protein